MTNRLAFGISGMLMILSMSTTVRAQVGHLPDRSPFQDLEQRQELSVLVGNFHGHRDPANVAPSGGLLVGLQYQWRAAGPAYLIGDFARISSDRRRLNPFLVGAARDLGTENQPLYTGSAGLGIGLTGGKTWHHLVPEITSGVGFISDFSSKPDTGGFKFGTRFALNFGGGSGGCRAASGRSAPTSETGCTP